MPRSKYRSFPDELTSYLVHQNAWSLHFAFYLNTYTFALHLGRALHSRKVAPEGINRRVRRHDLWGNPPAFTHDAGIELFVATDAMLQRAREDHRHIHEIEFTKYHLARVFLHGDKLGLEGRTVLPKGARRTRDLYNALSCVNGRRVIVVTDIPETANQFLSSMKEKFGELPNVQFEIRLYWQRNEGDFYDPATKLYVFSAPLAQELASQEKYLEFCVPEVAPIRTYLAFRISSGVKDHIIRDLSSGAKGYFGRLFEYANKVTTATQGGRTPSKEKWWDGVSSQYSRMARSMQQPDPFARTEYEENQLTYLSLLSMHHRKRTS
jgi:hypothetical protein